MVSEFFTPVGRLCIFDAIPDHQLLQDPSWPLDEIQKPCRYCTELLEYSKNNYWDGNKITDQTVNLAIQIFPYAFFDCQALFTFDNAANHACFEETALLAKKMNLEINGKQPQMRDRFNNKTQRIQLIVFSDNHLDVLLWSKLKRSK